MYIQILHDDRWQVTFYRVHHARLPWGGAFEVTYFSDPSCMLSLNQCWSTIYLQQLTFLLLTVVSYANDDNNLGNPKLTEPEFSIKISKPSSVVSPVTKEIHTTVLTSLKHLQLHRNNNNHNHRHHHHHHHHHEKHIGPVTNYTIILHLHKIKEQTFWFIIWLLTTMCLKNTPPYFLNNAVKNKPIFTILVWRNLTSEKYKCVHFIYMLPPGKCKRWFFQP